MYVQKEWPIYCNSYSKHFTDIFLKELTKITSSETQVNFWNFFTNYTAHHDAGDSAKMYFKNNPELNERLDFLYYCYDNDEKNLNEWKEEKELQCIWKTLEKEGTIISQADFLLAELKWKRDKAIHNGDWPTVKILDYLK